MSCPVCTFAAKLIVPGQSCTARSVSFPMKTNKISLHITRRPLRKRKNLWGDWRLSSPAGFEAMAPKPFCAHFAQFLSSLAFDKKTSALRRSFLVPTFVYRHRFISLLVIRMPVSYMTEVRRRAGRLLGLHSITSSARRRIDEGTVRPS